MSTRNITITTRLKDPNNPNGEIYTRAIIKNAIDNNTQIIAGADAQDEFNPSISPYVYKQVNQTEEYVATVLINNSNEGSTPPPPGLSVPLCVFTLNGDACILSRTAARDVLRHILDFGFDGDDLWNLFVALMTATRWLHEKKILHGDIKPENLLVYQTQQGLEFKLFDYDACIVDCSEDTDDIKKRDHRLHGTRSVSVSSGHSCFRHVVRWSHAIRCGTGKTLVGKTPCCGSGIFLLP